MGLDLLDTPVRLTWDLHGSAALLDADGMLAVAAKIADGGVFYVTLEERPLTHPEIHGIVAILVGAGCRLQLACDGSAAELAALRQMPAPLPGIQLDVAGFIEEGLLDAEQLGQSVTALCRLGIEVTLRLTPLADKLAVIPQLLDFCARHDAGRLKLSNARIGDSFPADAPEQLPRWSDLDTFRELWAKQALPLPETLQLEIHDRFLWEIMAPELEQARSEYGGCQAANSLGHVDAAGNVHACAAWPERLGSLLDAALDEIWSSPGRLALRERIARTPDGCLGCRDYALCLGGCRGLGELLNDGCGGRDLMCREPRR